jgi:hypothetical protein
VTAGRRKVPPPRGRITLQQAADLSGLGYHRVYTLVTSGEVPGDQDASGVWTIARKDAARIKRREPAGDKRKAVMLRPDLERYAAWARAAGARPVSSWLAALADAASGYKP